MELFSTSICVKEFSPFLVSTENLASLKRLFYINDVFVLLIFIFISVEILFGYQGHPGFSGRFDHKRN